MKYIPTLFSTEMVQPLINELKCKTRRVKALDEINKQPNEWEFVGFEYNVKGNLCAHFVRRDQQSHHYIIPSPYGEPGDILWVRETLYQDGELGLRYYSDNEYIADDIIPQVPFKNGSYRNYAHCQVPNIHMPAWACRLFLKVKSLRVERLHDISPSDALNEGVEYWNVDPYALEGGELQADFKNYTWTEKKEQDPNYNDRYFPTFSDPVSSFRTLWESINGEQSWKDNPWVWVIEFKRINKPQNWPL